MHGNQFYILNIIFDPIFNRALARKWIKNRFRAKTFVYLYEFLDEFCRTFRPRKPHFLVTFAPTAGCPYPSNFIFERVFLGFLDFDSI